MLFGGYFNKLKLKREHNIWLYERKFIQERCPHDYKLIYTHKKEYKYLDLISYHYDLYCPVCEATLNSVDQTTFDKIKLKSQIREEYHNNVLK